MLPTIKTLFEEESYEKLYRLEPICSTCHLLRPARSRHSRFSPHCIPKFDHYSPYLDICVGAGNRKVYFAALAVHTLAVSLFLALELLSCSVRVPETDFVPWFVTCVYLFVNSSFPHVLLVAGCVLVWWHSFWYLFVEVYSISQGLTVHEALNRHRCRYLFSPCVGEDKGPKLRYKNPFHKGVLKNWVEFFAND